MKERILKNWTPIRFFYTVIGIALTAQAIFLHEWLLVGAGVYFSLMGLLGFGCAGGNCRR